MTAYALLVVAAAGASALTLFSGFGLGTVLLPVFLLFFPVEVAVGATAVVHFANNLFKAGLVGRHADRRVVLRFGLPAVAATVPGAFLLVGLADLPPIAAYDLFGRACAVTPVKILVGGLMLAFAAIEVRDAAPRALRGDRGLLLGGLLSGFFGGLSGHQGAFRSAVLVGAGLSTEAFVGTNTLIALLVDLCRIPVYGLTRGRAVEDWTPVAVGAAAAFVGAFAGARLVRKTTIGGVRRLVAALLVVMGIAVGTGIV